VWSPESNFEVVQTPVALFMCPSEPSESTQSGDRIRDNWGWPVCGGSLGTCGQEDIAVTCYKGMAGYDRYYESSGDPDGMFELRTRPTHRNLKGIRMRDLTDGSSNVIAVGELSPSWTTWSSWAGSHSEMVTRKPINWMLTQFDHPSDFWAIQPGTHLWEDVQSASSFHPGGCNFLFADGSVHFLTETMDVTTYRDLADYNNGRPVGGFSP